MKQGGWRKRASERDGWGTWGGYMSAKVQKLEDQFCSEAAIQHQKDGTSSSIFSEVAIYVNGFTDPSADELRRLMMLHGGQYHVYYSRSKTTHIIATNLPNAKIKELKGEKVVRPEWITESIKAGCLLSYIPYQLYTKQSSIQKGLCFNTICKPEDPIPDNAFILSSTKHPSCIMHVDMDCFFVSVGIREKPDLKGKPVAVTSNRGSGKTLLRPGANPQLEWQYYQNKLLKGKAETGKLDLSTEHKLESPQVNGNEFDISVSSMAEIASCSYEARQAGIKNGMFFGQAKRLCPDLQAVSYDFQSYKAVAQTMYEILASYTHNIEAVSCDEALVDITEILAETGLSPEEIANAIRTEIKNKTKCSASIGIGSNILLARMATRSAKPDGQYHLKPEEVDDFIRSQLIIHLPGVGRTMESKLSALGIKTCGDLQCITMSKLQQEFGPKTGQMLFRFCRGLDDRPVQREKERKSVSAEINYGIRFTQ
ncbi:PREDICTED: DNA repair protein REV1-like, partial [Gekko japonicus]|uniref:DNA repair protein REV1-like n=1 Tax=Gekko japonicus TaxID=146911 RepID=A0ABM1LGV1_GEKJA